MKTIFPAALRFLCACVVLLSVHVFAAQTGSVTAGGLTDLPKELTEIIALANAGFEADLTSWLPAKPPAFSVTSDGNVAHSGKACLRFDAGQSTSFVPSIRQPLPQSRPGACIVRFWIKTRDLGSKGKSREGVRVALGWNSIAKGASRGGTPRKCFAARPIGGAASCGCFCPRT